MICFRVMEDRPSVETSCREHAAPRIYHTQARAIQAARDKGAEDPERGVYECAVCKGWHLTRKVRGLGRTHGRSPEQN